jgi:hypothetical protein
LSSEWGKIGCGRGTWTLGGPRGKGPFAVRSRYVRTDEEAADREDSLRAVVNGRVRIGDSTTGNCNYVL